MVKQSASRYVLGVSRYCGVQVFFAGQEAIHTFLRKFVQSTMRLSSEVLEPLFLRGGSWTAIRKL